jgi:hypothetical protein
MKTIKSFKFAGILFFLLGLGIFSQTTAQTTTWEFSDGSAGQGQWKIVEKSHVISEVHVIANGATVTNPLWLKCSVEKLDDYGSYTYIRIKQVENGKTQIRELNLYWDEEKLTRVNADGTTKNFWLKK